MEQIYNDLKKYIGKKRKCIVCGSGNFSLWAGTYYLRALKCRNCGMVSVNPHINQAGLNLFYSTYLGNRFKDKRLFNDRKEMYKLEYEFLSNFISGGSVLDVGCSGGFFLNEFDKNRWIRRGVEIDPGTAAYARNKFGIDVIAGNFPDLNLGKNKFDLIVFRGVIEHCINPENYFKKCAAVLKNKGMLFITATPNVESFCAEIYREKWRLFTPIEHIHFFSVGLLNRMLEPLGFKLLERKYFYEETPYADLKADYKKMKADILSITNGRRKVIKKSPPFWGNMLTGIWCLNR
ncbi:MAG: class I SAM-dependent methyltransferase [Candidatus Omnitrophota bacterium]